MTLKRTSELVGTASRSKRGADSQKPKSRDKDETRRRLLEAATQEFCASGYFGTDTNQIARTAGLAPGSFYNHYKDKLEVFLHVFAGFADREREEVFSALRHDGEPRDHTSLARALIDGRKRWAKFRASLEMLTRTEAGVVEARRVNQGRTILLITGMPVEQIDPDARSEMSLRFLIINAVTDSVATSQSLVFGISEQDAVATVSDALTAIARTAAAAAASTIVKRAP